MFELGVKSSQSRDEDVRYEFVLLQLSLCLPLWFYSRFSRRRCIIELLSLLFLLSCCCCCSSSSGKKGARRKAKSISRGIAELLTSKTSPSFSFSSRFVTRRRYRRSISSSSRSSRLLLLLLLIRPGEKVLISPNTTRRRKTPCVDDVAATV